MMPLKMQLMSEQHNYLLNIYLNDAILIFLYMEF